MSEIVEAEAAMGRALARQAWRRLRAADSAFAMDRYPGGEDEYAEVEWMRYREDAMAALSALEAKGWAVVPKVPTKAMIEIGGRAVYEEGGPPTEASDRGAARAYAAMISACPPSLIVGG